MSPLFQLEYKLKSIQSHSPLMGLGLMLATQTWPTKPGNVVIVESSIFRLFARVCFSTFYSRVGLCECKYCDLFKPIKIKQICTSIL